jgi:hypothetical protein
VREEDKDGRACADFMQRRVESSHKPQRRITAQATALAVAGAGAPAGGCHAPHREKPKPMVNK